MLPFARRAPRYEEESREPRDPYGAPAPRGSLPPAFTSAPSHRSHQQHGHGYPAPRSHRDMYPPPASVELAPEIHADARRLAAPHAPHSLSPVAMAGHTSSNTGQQMVQTVSSRGRPTLTGGVAILLAGVVAGGSFGILMKANQDQQARAAAAARREAAETNVAPNVATMSGTNAVATAALAQAAGAQQVQVAPVNPPPAQVVATQSAPEAAPDTRAIGASNGIGRAGVVAPTKTTRTVTGRGFRAPASPPPARHAEPPPAPARETAKAEKPEPAPAKGGIRTVKIQAPAAEPPPEKPEKPAKAAPAKAEKPEKPARTTKSSDDLLEEAIKNTSNVL